MADPVTPRVDFQSELSGLFRLDGQVVLLPGGHGGIGEAIAWGAAIIGATIVICGRDQDKASALVGPALFFAASASGFVTGQNLLVDGGFRPVSNSRSTS